MKMPRTRASRGRARPYAVWFQFALAMLMAHCPGARAVDVIAHRALGCGDIENSVAAVAAAWAIGAKAVELDVRVSDDGIAYTFHDAEIGSTSVTGLTLRNIQRLAGPSAAPRLSAMLAVSDPAGYFVLDLKQIEREQLPNVAAAVLASAIAPSRFTFQSEHVDDLVALKELLPSARFFYLARLRRTLPFFRVPKPARLIRRLAPYALDGVSVKGRQFIDQDFIDAFKASGLAVYVWTINDLQRAAHYAALGVDGIITDRADDLLSHFDGDGGRAPQCPST